MNSPAFFIFQTKNVDAATWADDVNNIWYPEGQNTQTFACFAVPNEWILDGIEVFSYDYPDDCQKRLTADIDGGAVWLTKYQGHTLYRNVDKAATEALPENAGKLVYDYSLGVGESTDPSGIDAEASMKQGAHIIFQDFNNSTEDFHERQRCSLRD